MKISTNLSLLLQNIMRSTDLTTGPHQWLLSELLPSLSLSHVFLPGAIEHSFIISHAAPSQTHSPS